jgi:mRNA interferase MazF
MVRLEPNIENNLAKISAVDTFQIRSVSENRLVRKLGALSEPDMLLISQALTIVLSI